MSHCVHKKDFSTLLPTLHFSAEEHSVCVCVCVCAKHQVYLTGKSVVDPPYLFANQFGDGVAGVVGKCLQEVLRRVEEERTRGGIHDQSLYSFKVDKP